MYKKIDKVVLLVMSFLLISGQNTIWFRFSFIKFISIISILLITVYSFFRILPILKRNEFYKIVITIIGICSGVIAISLFQGKNRIAFLFNFCVIFNCIAIISIFIGKYKYKIMIYMNKIIILISSISLVFYFLGSIFHVISPLSYFMLNWGRNFLTENYFYLYYSYQNTTLAGMVIPRNSSIFLEPAIFSFYLVFSLIIELFYKTTPSKKNIVLMIICLFTTFSTIGLILMLLILGIKFIFLPMKNKLGQYLRLYFIPIIIVCISISAYFVLLDKIDNQYGNKSFDVRMNDIEIGIEAFLDKPIVGWGYRYSDDYKSRQLTSIRGSDISGGSNGLIVILYQCGVIIFCFYIITFILGYKLNRKDNGGKFSIIFYIYLLIYLFTIPIMYSWFLIYIMSFGIYKITIDSP